MSAECSCGAQAVCAGMCTRCRGRAYYAANRERVLATKRAWRARNAAKEAAKSKEYRDRKRALIHQREAEYYRRNRDAILAKRKAYRLANHDKVLAYEREYRERMKPELKSRRLARAAAVKPPAEPRRQSYEQIVRVGVPGWGARA